MLRKRFWLVWMIPLSLVGWMLWSDPDEGLSTGMMLTGLGSGVLAVTCAHLARKWLLDYPDADLRRLFQAALAGNTAAGQAIIGICILMAALLMVFAPRAHAQDLPPNAITYLPMLKAEQMRGWPDHPAPSILAGQVEQETCVSLKHSRCWSPAAKLKTDREEGAGFGQLTRAWSAGGGLRFDTLDAVRAIDPGLASLSWANVYQRPDLQLRALVAMNHDCHLRIGKLVEDTGNKFCFCLAAYNGGYGGLQAERRACHLAGNCDPDQWFGNVERHCLKSKVKWKGYGASACDINREYVPNVFITRRQKYKAFFGEI